MMNRGPVTLTPHDLHTMSNHFTVILGFIELLIAETPPEHHRHADLIEIRKAAAEAARMIGHAYRIAEPSGRPDQQSPAPGDQAAGSEK